MIFAAMVKVISLKCVQQRTNPKKVTACNTKKVNTPDFQATSCSYSYAFIYNFLNKCTQEKINNISTPLS